MLKLDDDDDDYLLFLLLLQKEGRVAELRVGC
jgi:hypothetical protein